MTALFTTNKGGVSNMRYHFVHGAICINLHGKDIKALLSCLQKFVFVFPLLLSHVALVRVFIALGTVYEASSFNV